MPAIVGIIKVNAISSSAVFNVGDAYHISPYAESKTFAGAGSFNTGDHIKTYNPHNVTHTVDTDTFDQNNMLNT